MTTTAEQTPPVPPPPPPPDCAVCGKNYTQELRKRVTCARCGFQACRACTKKYIEMENTDAKCMKCFRTWDRDFINSNFPISWIKGPYRDLRQRLLVDREKALLPSSQHMVSNYRLANALRVHIHNLDDVIYTKTRELGHLNRLRHQEYARLVAAEANNYRGNYKGSANIRNVYSNRPCPVASCRGYLDADWVCGLCHGAVCRTCHVALVPGGEPHACNADDVASVRVIQESSKPCPNCNMAIAKTEGCDQMWCTACDTAFLWSTGNIVGANNRIHNPHYYAANHHVPREVGDIPCGGLCRFEHLEIALVNTAVGRAMVFTSEFYKHIVFSFYVVVHEKSDVQRRLYSLRAVHNRIDNSDLRLQYLLGKLTEEQWKSMLYSRENLREKKIMVRQVYETFVWSVTETLSAFVDGQMSLAATCEQLMVLLRIANAGLADIECGFDMKCPRINLPKNPPHPHDYRR